MVKEELIRENEHLAVKINQHVREGERLRKQFTSILRKAPRAAIGSFNVRENEELIFSWEVIFSRVGELIASRDNTMDKNLLDRMDKDLNATIDKVYKIEKKVFTCKEMGAPGIAA